MKIALCLISLIIGLTFGTRIFSAEQEVCHQENQIKIDNTVKVLEILCAQNNECGVAQDVNIVDKEENIDVQKTVKALELLRGMNQEKS